MQRRGWIKPHTDVAELEAEINAFFAPNLCVATRRSVHSAHLTPVQNAWCQRARQMASALSVAPFKPQSLDQLTQALRKLAAYPKEVRHLPGVLAKYGLRFVVVEPLASEKLDGAAFWLDDHSPVIAVSARFDRIDAFWFTVMHELAHIKNGDALSVDTELVADSIQASVIAKDSVEQIADKEAANSLIPSEELDSFIRRLGPLYSKERIIQFAHRVKIHPGIIVGQLQHRGELSYGSHRDMLVKLRSTITDAALTDGWGKTLAPESL
jgi:HTH-type transcriptional regulator/antitoxin HigA